MEQLGWLQEIPKLTTLADALDRYEEVAKRNKGYINANEEDVAMIAAKMAEVKNTKAS
ncbi:MAG: hypothetical protein WC736_10685 [Gallionella sp.]|jgi:hypothetical protein